MLPENKFTIYRVWDPGNPFSTKKFAKYRRFSLFRALTEKSAFPIMKIAAAEAARAPHVPQQVF
jgi:hypothetical protein